MASFDVILVGASVRAAAMSARRAGLRPYGIDLFAVVDLSAIAPVRLCPIERYPEDLPRLLAEAPQVPWIYTGGLENHPDLIEELAEIRPLWGNPGRVLRSLRSPIELARLLSAWGFRMPETRPLSSLPLEREELRDWLIKPFRSAAGLGICRAEQLSSLSDPQKRSSYCQRYVVGVPMSTLYCSDGTPGGTQWIGNTRQLIGEPWCNAPEFRYCGNIAPIDLPPMLALRFGSQALQSGSPCRSGAATKLPAENLGAVLVREFGLRGLFGVDWLLDAYGESWILEVNPRYTASLELLEFATGRAWLLDHAEAFSAKKVRRTSSGLQQDHRDDSRSPGTSSRCFGKSSRSLGTSSRCFGKAIVYARDSGEVPLSGLWNVAAADADDPWHCPTYADIPHPGTRMEAGWPVLSVLAQAPTFEEVLRALQWRRQALPMG